MDSQISVLEQPTTSVQRTPAPGNWTHLAIQGVVLLVLLRLLVVGAYRGAINDTGLRGIDHTQYYNAARRLEFGHDLYVTSPDQLDSNAFPYSPWVAILFRATSSLTDRQSYEAWLLVMLGCLVASSIICAASFRSDRAAFSTLVCLFLITGFRFWPSVCELAQGNVEFVLLLFVSIMCWCAKRGWWFGVAVLIALAAMFKSWMIGFVLAPLVARKYWSALFSCAVATILLLLSFAIVGFHQLPKFLKAMQMYAVQPRLVALSASGMAKILFTQTEHMQPLINSNALRILFVVIMFAIVAGLIYFASSRALRLQSVNGMMVISFSGACILLALTLCHLSYFILLLPALWMLMSVPKQISPPRQLLSIAMGLIAYLLLASPSPTVDPIPDWARHGTARLLTIFPMVAAVLCAVALTLCIRSPGVRQASEDVQTIISQ